MAAGTFTVGDFALFTYYLVFATDLPALIGNFIGDYQAQEVSIDRLVALVPDEPPAVLLEHHPVYPNGGEAPPAATRRHAGRSAGHAGSARPDLSLSRLDERHPRRRSAACGAGRSP